MTRHPLRRLAPPVLAAAAVLCLRGAAAEPVDRPFALSVTVEPSGERLRGRVTGADDRGLLLETADGERELPWTQVDAAALMQAKGRLLGRDDGRGWVDTAWVLVDRGEAGAASEAALGRALRADPDLAGEAAAVRGGSPPSWFVPAPEAPPEAPPGAGAPEDVPGDGPPGTGDAGEGGYAGVPEVEGEPQLERWGELSPELMQTGLEEQEAWLAVGMQTTGLRLDVYRDVSEHFLLVTDLDRGEAQRWARELDRMYEVMCGMFELDPSKNLFLGKAAIVIFGDEDEYHRWNAGVLGNPFYGTLGVCLSSPDGHVRISFFRQKETAAFASLLVHETTHGFLHRYKSPARVPSWLNEGLAETVSHRLFPGGEDLREIRRWAARMADTAATHPQSFFDAVNIPGPYYPVAYHFTEWMLAQDGERFRAMFDAIKDGKDPDEAVAEDYGVPREELLRLFSRAMSR